MHHTVKLIMSRNLENKDPQDRRKHRFLIAFSLVFAQVLFVLVIGYFLIEKFFGTKTVAQYLPAGNTVAFAEIFVDPQEQQLKKISENLKDYSTFSNTSIQNLITSIWPEYPQAADWIGRKVGVAFLQTNQMNQSATPVLFVEVKNLGLAINFLKERALNEDDFIQDEFTFPGFKLYSFKAGQRFYALQLENYLVFANNSEVLKQITDVKSNRLSSLKNDETYTQVQNGLPSKNLGFLYVNNQKVLQALLNNEQYLQTNISFLTNFLPFMQIFSAQGTAFIADNNSVKIYDQTILNKSNLPEGKLLSFNTKYQGKLLRFLPQEPTMLFAGRDLSSEINALKSVFAKDKIATSLIFEGYLNQAKDLFTDQNLNLESDILPLLKGEYLVSINQQPEGDSWLAIIEIADRSGVENRLQKIQNALQKRMGTFAPKERILTLEDGTTAKILEASTEVKKSTIVYGNYTIDILEASPKGPYIYFLDTKENLIFANNLKNLEAVVDRITNTNPTSTITALSNLNLNNADEVIYLNFNQILNELSEGNPVLKLYTQPLKNLTLTREYSENKIISTAIIEIK